MIELNHATLHASIIRSFLELQRPPTINEVASQFDCNAQDARSALRALADYHGVVLRPESDEIWVAHPFSATPTTFVVRCGSFAWWGNCAWCSLGVVHLSGGNAVIETRIGAVGESATIRIQNSTLIDTDFLVHFPVPMQNAWDNVLYTCSVMLIFRDHAQVDEWCTTRGVPKGDVRPIEQVWRFAAEWYSRHADVDWKKWSAKEADEIFRRHRLAGPTWHLSEASERF